MRFQLIDSIIERSPDRIVAVKQVSQAEEYLADHFPSFPVLPGVLMIEAMVQAARALLPDRDLVLGEVKSIKFGNMVRPGEALMVEVTLSKQTEDGSYQFKGTGAVRKANGSGEPETAVSGQFTLRPVKKT